MSEEKKGKKEEKGKTFALQLSDIMKSAEEDRSLEMLFMLKDKKLVSDLSGSQLTAILKINQLAKLLEIPELMDITEEFLTLKISHDRQSRKEILELKKADTEIKEKKGLFSRWFGGND